MSVIRVSNLTFAYDGSYDNIFENVSFQLDTSWRLGFIGRNGRGKTTFLNLLLGKYEYSGTISASVEFAYFPYPVKDPSKMTMEVMNLVCPNAEDWELMKEASLLDVDTEALYRPFDTLSHGEQTKVLLAALFLGENKFLLIDEPTNHLDMDARKRVGEYLLKKSGFILVSHDRTLLDLCADHILSVNKCDIEVQQGNFTSWWNNRQMQDEYEASENEKLKKEIDRLSASAKRTSDWSDKTEKSKKGTDAIDSGYIGHKSAKLMKRAKTRENRIQSAMEEKSKLLRNTEQTDGLKLSPLVYMKPLLVNAAEFSAYYEEKTVFRNIGFQIRRGDRIAVNGKNGSGKSTLLKLICGRNIRYDGILEVGSNLKISYVSQDTSDLSGLLSDYAREKNVDESQFKTILRKMGFERVQFEKDMRDFSGGQKKKVLIAASLCEQAHLYVWDEPLNYIDVISRIQIEDLITEFAPTMIFVEHDAAFQDKIATKKIEL